MLVKIHKSCREVVAICDKDLLGKEFHEGKKKILDVAHHSLSSLSWKFNCANGRISGSAIYLYLVLGGK